MQPELVLAPSPVASEDERQLLVALRDGDEPAFTRLVERNDPMLRRVARGFVDSDAVAEEIVQETWLAVIRGISRFQGRSTLSTWIFSIMINQAKTHGSRERRVTPFSSVGPANDADVAVDADRFQTDDDAWPGHWATPPRPWHKPERRLLSLEARDRLKSALEALPERQRLVVSLRDVEGLTAEEVCAMLDIGAENQRVLLHRGRSRLRTILDEYVHSN